MLQNFLHHYLSKFNIKTKDKSDHGKTFFFTNCCFSAQIKNRKKKKKKIVEARVHKVKMYFYFLFYIWHVLSIITQPPTIVNIGVCLWLWYLQSDYPAWFLPLFLQLQRSSAGPWPLRSRSRTRFKSLTSVACFSWSGITKEHSGGLCWAWPLTLMLLPVSNNTGLWFVIRAKILTPPTTLPLYSLWLTPGRKERTGDKVVGN